VRFRDRLVAAWYAPRVTPLVVPLLPLSWLFGAAVALRRALYRNRWLARERVAAKVVVTGNLTVGGSGKTPLAIALADALAARGRHPGLVSRGYGGTALEPREVRAGDDPGQVGDEPPLLAAAGHPVWIGRDRVAAARALLARHPQCDVVIADDGLQHYRLERDVEIAVVDARRGFGNGRMLPAGPMREPLSRLADVDAVVRLVEAEVAAAGDASGRDTSMVHAPLRLRNLLAPDRDVDPASWPKGGVHAVAGIGHPERFFDLLRRLGIDAVPHPFPDHHAFVPADLAFPGAAAIVMTAKDAVKCARFADPRLHALDIRAAIDPALVNLVLARLDGRQAA
jgi:tetraacyldisaccharide 4'-kinase